MSLRFHFCYASSFFCKWQLKIQTNKQTKQDKNKTILGTKIPFSHVDLKVMFCLSKFLLDTDKREKKHLMSKFFAFFFCAITKFQTAVGISKY